MDFNINEFMQFTVQAKLNTYASEGDEATVIPTLNGSKQLEFLSGDYFYRDIYFGMEYFIGQETIEYMGSPIWSILIIFQVLKLYIMKLIEFTTCDIVVDLSSNAIPIANGGLSAEKNR